MIMQMRLKRKSMLGGKPIIKILEHDAAWSNMGLAALLYSQYFDPDILEVEINTTVSDADIAKAMESTYTDIVAAAMESVYADGGDVAYWVDDELAIAAIDKLCGTLEIEEV